MVPKPTKHGKPCAAATVTLGGKEIWDGNKLVGTVPGVCSARDGVEGIAFETTNGELEFVSTAL